ncbi:MAG: carboxymuconolactone decarboxylase family protein [Pseudopedobacter sp.]|nr:carboxymuconolactone decarboxylase family protein [Deinococcales bacterium]
MTHTRDTLWGDQKERIEARLEGLDPDLKTYILEFAYGEIYARGGLELKFKELLAVVMLMSLGASGELKTHLRGALRAGATELELRETLLFAIPYLGFPRVVGGFAVLKELLEEKAKGNVLDGTASIGPVHEL